MRNWIIWTVAGASVALLAPIGIAALFIGALQAGFFRDTAVGYLETHFNRPIRIDGPLQMHLWTRHPRIVATQVVIGNPPWIAAGDMAVIGRLMLTFSVENHGLNLEKIVMEGGYFHVIRDAAGGANWQRFDPKMGKIGRGLPLIRELSAPNAHLVLDDELRHLKFDGIVTARNAEGGAGPPRLHMEGRGQLNGRPAELELDGEPLATVRRDVAYAFDFSERSSGSRLDLHGTLPKPFDFNLMDAAFDARGPDLSDLYFLTGVRWVSTGAFRISGNIIRRGMSTRFEQLGLTTGQSDISGSLSRDVTPGGGVPSGSGVARASLLQGTLTAKVLHLADFGARAAGRGPPPGTPARFFSDSALNVDALRRSDFLIRFDARRVDIGRAELRSVSGQMKIVRGIVTFDVPKGELMQGTLNARVKMDANVAIPAVDVNMSFRGLQMAGFGHEGKEAPLEGSLDASVDISGRGSSLHGVAATATGAIRATLSHGMIRASLAELTGVDLRGVGLTLTRSKRETTVRCAAANFAAHEGTLTARSLFMDTAPVLIKGDGIVQLDSESLDIALRGEPKDVRFLRVDAPVTIRGTLTHPSFGIRARDSSVKLIDPGRAKDVDCSS